MATTINTLKVMSLLQEAVKLKGADYVYTSEHPDECLYNNDDGTPSCIVGYVFDSLGLKVPEEANSRPLRTMGTTTYPTVQPPRVHVNLVSTEVEFTPGAFEALTMAQSYQDQGVDWGTAVEYAKESVHKNVTEKNR
jgi:hypothetical protein